LKKLLQALEKHEHNLQEAIYQDFKKNRTETTLTEILPLRTEIKHAISQVRKWTKPQYKSNPIHYLGTTAYIQYEPKGVSLILSPWNYPIMLTLSPLVSAIAAGCTSILKPSELTPHTSAALGKLIKEIFDESEVALVEGDVNVSTALLELPFNHIFFTGSPMIGKIVMKAASAHLTSVTLELGGKSPAFIDESADLQDTAEKLVWGKFVNNGQTCIAPDYLLVKDIVQKPLIEHIEKQIEKVYNSDKQGIEKSDSYCRIVSQRHFTRLQGLMEDALLKGASIATGGKTNAEDRFIAPTVLTDIKPEMSIMQEEIFGPLLPILTYKNTEEAINIVNEGEKPLALYVFSKNKEMIEKVMTHTSAGGASINECLLHIGHPELPFGGVNNSGIGKSHGYFGFLEFSNAKAVLKQRIGFTGFKLLYPPYNQKVKDLVKKLKKIL
ncbi:MAG: aldehyde dehydrogenase family protein, partial [Thermoflexibacter sp.]|nr:aldehyde dehydrogenase family protein [Thermoflexibacter sp.]